MVYNDGMAQLCFCGQQNTFMYKSGCDDTTRSTANNCAQVNNNDRTKKKPTSAVCVCSVCIKRNNNTPSPTCKNAKYGAYNFFGWGFCNLFTIFFSWVFFINVQKMKREKKSHIFLTFSISNRTTRFALTILLFFLTKVLFKLSCKKYLYM